jgi:NIMA (never in mitosis gene a)-related kinase
MEFCEGGDLGAIIQRAKKEGSSIDEEFIWKVFSQMIVALKECHRHKEGSGKTKPIVHRDIKPGNIFLDSLQNIKVGDFGLAKELASDTKFATTNVGTPFYMSPEMINELKYNEKSDIWALGCLLFELAALVPPFEATNHLTLAVKINAGKFNRIPSKYSDDLYRAIRWMLQVDVSIAHQLPCPCLYSQCVSTCTDPRPSLSHMQASKRPAVEDLEKMPRIKNGLDCALAIVAAAQGVRPGSAKPITPTVSADPADLARREAAVATRESEVARREAAVHHKIAELSRREAAVVARERELFLGQYAVPSSRPSTAGSVTSTTSSVHSLQQQMQHMPSAFAAQAQPALHRAYSANDLPVHQPRAPSSRPSSAAGQGHHQQQQQHVYERHHSAGGIPTTSINLQGEADPVGYSNNSPAPLEESDPSVGAGAAHLPSFQPAMYTYERTAGDRAPLAPRPQQAAMRQPAAIPSKLQALAQLQAAGAENIAPNAMQVDGNTMNGHGYIPRAL